MTAADLAGTRLVPAPAPAIELHGWVQSCGSAASTIESSARVEVDPAKLAMVRAANTVPAPGFLHPAHHEFDHALEDILATPNSIMRDDYEDIAGAGIRPPAWTHDLARGNRRLRNEFAAALRHVYATGVAPRLERAQQTMLADNLRRRKQVVEGGIGAMLAGLHPDLRWRPPVLEVQLRRAKADFDVNLGGHGLLLIPSLAPYLFVTVNNDRPSVIAYPVSFSAIVNPDPATDRLAGLIGGSRARILNTIANRPGISGRTLCQALSLSPATMSEHLTILRANKLITTTQTAGQTHHYLASLGLQLRDG